MKTITQLAIVTLFVCLSSVPAFAKGLPELEKIEKFLKAKLLEYDPIYKDILTVN